MKAPVKEKKERKADFSVLEVVAVVVVAEVVATEGPDRRKELTERQKRKRDAAKKSTSIATRGVRIFRVRTPARRRGGV